MLLPRFSEIRKIRPGSVLALPNIRRPPVLIGGCSRSGNTLLVSVLDAHPAICGIPWETYIFSRSDAATPHWLKLARVYAILARMEVPMSTRRWCEKSPANVRAFASILKEFRDEARLIHIIRDGRDVITSKHPSRPGEYYTPISRWVEDVTAGLEFENHPAVFTVRYEDLVTEFHGTIGKLLSFVGEQVCPEVLEFQNHTSIKANAAWFGGVRAVSSSSVNKWQRPEHADRIREFESNEAAMRLMHRLAYC